MNFLKTIPVSFGVSKHIVTIEEESWNSLEDGKNEVFINHSSIGKVIIKKLVTIWGNYYKISANILNVRAPYFAHVNINISRSIADEDLPNVDYYLSSEESAIGASMYNWIDGDRFTINEVKGTNK